MMSSLPNPIPVPESRPLTELKPRDLRSSWTKPGFRSLLRQAFLSPAGRLPLETAGTFVRPESALRVTDAFLVERDINVDGWIESLSYGELEGRRLTIDVAEEFGLPTDDSDLDLIEGITDFVVSADEKKYGVQLSEQQRRMFRNLVLRMALDKLSFP